jgi:putative oxidoreductase
MERRRPAGRYAAVPAAFSTIGSGSETRARVTAGRRPALHDWLRKSIPDLYDAFMASQAGWLDRNREIAPFLFRLFIAFVLIYGTYDNVASEARMHEFRDFLSANGFPMALEMAYLSAYGQFIAGLLLVVGFLTRAASLVVIVNFVVALVMVHLKLPWSANIAPLAMLVGGIFFLLYGAPRYSVDALLAARR